MVLERNLASWFCMGNTSKEKYSRNEKGELKKTDIFCPKCEFDFTQLITDGNVGNVDFVHTCTHTETRFYRFLRRKLRNH